MAYAADPYPSPSRIEELANQIGVGTKTIVNWFHNHRMRAKQQPSSAGSGNGSIKSEPEDISNQSDAHSPASSSPAPGTGVRAGAPPGDGGSQWMFPTFEPVHMLRNRHEEYLSAMNDQQGQDLSVVKPEPPSDVTQTNGGVEELSPKPPTPDLIENMSNAEADQSNNNKPSKGNQEERKNRRKSSRPKWVYEGLGLESTAENGTNGPAETLKSSSEESEIDEAKTEELRASSLQNDEESKLIKEDGKIAQLSKNSEKEEEEEEEWEF